MEKNAYNEPIASIRTAGHILMRDCSGRANLSLSVTNRFPGI